MKYILTWYNIVGCNQKIGTREELQPIIDRLNDCDTLYSLEPMYKGAAV